MEEIGSAGKIPQHPLQKIALSFSGGGYRAASFHLGAMSYLHRLQYNGKPLLENVKMISTVSGGTITGAVYALQKKQQKTFEEIYDFMLNRLSNLDLIKMGLEKLNPGAVWDSTHKRKNLINAFAELYDEHFTGGATLADLNQMNSHLDAVAFNSTEFNRSINFRFRNKGTGKIGNNFNSVSPDIAGEIKLADAIAASSCFPGGFEPIMWPADFAHDKANKLKLCIKEMKPAGLMDGGIYDNQGIDSILLYKKNEENYFDLLIISDVTSPNMKPFKPANDKEKTGFRSMTVKQFVQKLKKINSAINWTLFGLVALFALLPLINGYNNTWVTGLFLGISFSLFIVWSAKLLAVVYLKNRLQQKKAAAKNWIAENNLDFYYKRLSLLNIDELSIRRVEPLLKDRFNSLITLLMDVFLKVVRRLNYNKVYENDKWHYRRMSNLIRELTEEDFTQLSKQPNKPTEDGGLSVVPPATGGRNLKGSYDVVIGKNIKAVAEEASSFGTTLWFTEKEALNNMLGKLVATGQFTICYNMLDYLETLLFTPGNGFNELDQTTQQVLQAMHQQCLSDWNEFKERPLFLLHEMERNRKKES